MEIFGYKIEKAQPEVKSYTSYDFLGVASPSNTSKFGPVEIACFNWIAKNITEADMLFESWVRDGWVAQELPMALSFVLPNTNMTLSDKIVGAAQDLAYYNNACWVKLKQGDKHVGTQYVPWSNVTMDVSQDNKIISYLINNKPYAPQEVIHFKLGVDPSNPVRGLDGSGTYQFYKDADIAGAEFLRSMLSAPAPGMLLRVPEEMDTAAAARLARSLSDQARGRNAGQVVTTDKDVEVKNLNYSPADLNMEVFTDQIEARVCSMMGIPTSVLGLNTGQNPTYSNLREAQSIAGVNFLIPMWTVISKAITAQYTEVIPYGTRIRFDYSKTAAMVDQDLKQRATVMEEFKAGIIDRYTAKLRLGYTPTEADVNIYGHSI